MGTGLNLEIGHHVMKKMVFGSKMLKGIVQMQNMEAFALKMSLVDMK